MFKTPEEIYECLGNVVQFLVDMLHLNHCPTNIVLESNAKLHPLTEVIGST